MIRETHPELPFDAYKGDDAFVFVSYAHGDALEVYQDIGWLHQIGVPIWYDEGISPGHTWADDLANAIDQAALVVVFVSEHAIASDNVSREISYALDAHKDVLAIHLDETELPKGLKLSLGNRQAIIKPRRSQDDYRRALLGAVSDHVATMNPAIEPAASRAPRPVPQVHSLGLVFTIIGVVVAAVI